MITVRDDTVADNNETARLKSTKEVGLTLCIRRFTREYSTCTSKLAKSILTSLSRRV